MVTAEHNLRRALEARGMVLVLAGFVVIPSSYAQTFEQYRQRAIESSRAKSWDDAIANYRRALDFEPNDALTRFNLALALKYKGHARQAVDEFESVIGLRPKWAEAHFGLGATWLELNELAAARKELQTAVDLDAKNAKAHRLLARVAVQQNDLAFAQTELRRTLALQPSAETH